MITKSHWSIRLLAVIFMLFALPLLVGGVYLISLGGSWYYVFASLMLIASGILLFKNKIQGAWVFAIFFVITLGWTIFETGNRFWGWVPRVAVFAVFALLLTLVLPYLGQGVRKKIAYGLTAVVAACFVVAGVIAFIPQYSYQSAQAMPTTPVSEVAHDATQPDEDWRYYGRDEAGTRYSPLATINTENVKGLKRAWVYRTGDLPPVGKDNKWAAESTPLKVGNAVYVCSATNNVSRLDAATGKEVWKFKSDVAYDSIPYTAACRGLTYYESKVIPAGQACHRRIVLGTLDMRLLAIDTETGKLCENFGEHGQTNLLTGLGESVPGFAAITAPVPIVNDTIIVSQQVRDNQRRWAPSGVVRGYDAETGRFKWAWDVNRPDQTAEPKAGEEYSRGTPNSWTTMIGDNKLGLVYIPMGNSAADHFSALRSANENRVSSAVVALDVATGKERWVFQTVHKDVWDYDLGSPPTLFDYPNKQGVTVPAILIPTKLGQTFVLDRTNRKPILNVEERPAPKATLPDDPRAPTQPYSVEMPALKFPDLTESRMWGISPIDQMLCRIKFRQANYKGQFTPPSLDKPWIEYPGNNGGSDWGGMAYDANTGILIANWNNTPMYAQLMTRETANKEHVYSLDDPKFNGMHGSGRAMADTPYGVNMGAFYSPTQMLCSEPPYGMITAINMHNRTVLWQRPFGSAERNGPFGIGTHLPIHIGTPSNGGPVVTAGGVTFIAATTDDKIRAIDNRTGKELWSDTLPAGGQATPMTYAINGEQYLVIVAGGHHFMQTPVGDYVIAYKLSK